MLQIESWINTWGVSFTFLLVGQIESCHPLGPTSFSLHGMHNTSLGEEATFKIDYGAGEQGHFRESRN